MKWLSFRLSYCPGKDLLEKGKFAKAEPHLEKALAIFPSHPEATLALAQARWKLGKKEEARALLHAFLEKEPGSSQAHFLLGAFFSEEKDNQNALAAFETAVEKNPKNVEAWYELGKVCAKLGETGKALHAFKLVLQADPFILQSRLSDLQEKEPMGKKS